MQTRQVTTLPVKEYPVGDGDWDSNRVYPINLIVIHTEVGFKTSTENRFDDPNSHVSATYGVNEDGTIDHYVDEDNVAYANGNYAVNQRAISIEHEDLGQPNAPRTDKLYQASGKLVADICKFYDIPCDRQHIIKHSEVPYPTQCCDSLDIDRIVREAYGVLNPAPAEPAIIAPIVAQPVIVVPPPVVNQPIAQVVTDQPIVNIPSNTRVNPKTPVSTPFTPPTLPLAPSFWQELVSLFKKYWPF